MASLGDIQKELDAVARRADEAKRAFNALGGAAAGLKLPAVAAALRAVAEEEKRLAKDTEEAEKRRAKAIRDAINDAFQAAGKAAANLRGPFNVLQSALGAVQSSIVSFVAKANPGAVLRFQLALNDMLATIGVALTPALNQFTVVLKAIGSAFKGLDSDGKNLIAAIAAGTVGLIAFGAAALAVQTIMTAGILPAISAIVGAFGGFAFVSSDIKKVMGELASVFVGVVNHLGKVLAEFAGSDAFLSIAQTFAEVLGVLVDVEADLLHGFMPVLNSLAAVFKSIAPAIAPLVTMAVYLNPTLLILSMLGSVAEQATPYLMAFANVIVDVGRAAYNAFRTILSFVGVNLPDFDKPASRGAPKDATGTAVKSTSTQDVSSVLARARESAFAAGSGGKKPEERTANGMDELNRKAEDIAAQIKAFPAELAKLIGEELTRLFPKPVEKFDQAAENFGTRNADSIPNFLIQGRLPSASELADAGASLARSIFD